MKLFDDTSVPILSKALDAYSLRHKVISSNIANIGTVGYKSRSVRFEEQLAGALSAQEIVPEATDSRHFGATESVTEEGTPQVVDAANDPSMDGDPTASGVNDVDIDKEMTELAKNQIQFKFATKLLGESFQNLEKSIRGTT